MRMVLVLLLVVRDFELFDHAEGSFIKEFVFLRQTAKCFVHHVNGVLQLFALAVLDRQGDENKPFPAVLRLLQCLHEIPRPFLCQVP